MITMKQIFMTMGKLLALMMPILITQMSTVGIGFLNTVMAGHASAVDLAGVSVGAGLFLPVFESVIGLLMAASPIIAQMRGQNQLEKVPGLIRLGLYIALGIGVAFHMLYSFGCHLVFTWMGIEASVALIAERYLFYMVITMYVGALIIPLRSLVDAMGHPALSMQIFLLAIPINGILDYLLVYGNWGFPKLGGSGAGAATALTYIAILFFFLFVVIRRNICNGRHIFQSFSVSFTNVREYLRLGIPSGLGVFMETSVFGFLMVLMAKFGTDTLAAYQVANNYANMVYMFPLSCSMALTILVGVSIGARNIKEAQRYRTSGLLLALAGALCTVVVTVHWHESIALLYADNWSVARDAGLFLLFAAGWQFFDAIAAPIQGILRGYKDAAIPFILSLFAYWGIGIPAGVFIDHYLWGHAAAYWAGLVFSIACLALFMIVRLHQMESKVFHLYFHASEEVDDFDEFIQFLLQLYAPGMKEKHAIPSSVILPQGHVMGGYSVGKSLYGIANCGQVP